MSKEDKDRKKDNVIIFPGLKDRLFQMGIDRLEKHEFQESADLLHQAKELGYKDPEIDLALIVALYESREYTEAKLYAEDLLHKGIGDYFEITDLYLMVLIQLGEHDQLIHTVEALFEEQHVPIEKMDHYRTLLELSRKAMADEHAEPGNNDDLVFDIDDHHNLHEQTMLIGGLADKNIQPYMKQLLAMLCNESSHPFLQTIVLNVLKEHNISQSVKVKKLGYEGEFVPGQLAEISQMPTYKAVANRLAEELEHENPVLLQQLMEMMKRHLFLLFPFEPESAKVWAAAYRALGQDLYGEPYRVEQLAEAYEIPAEQLSEIISFIRTLERISTPGG